MTTKTTQRVYESKKMSCLIVCHKGCHYTSPPDTAFTITSRVTVERTGEDGVRVSSPDGALQETWALRGSYQRPRGEAKAPTVTDAQAPTTTQEGGSQSALDSLLESAIKRTKVRQAV